MRILIVEDEEMLADATAEGLRDQAIAVDVAYDGEDALYRTSYNDYDVIVLDRDLPGVHGDDVCRELVRGPSPARILMLTAADEVGDVIDGLSLGADDYLTKPFVFGELVARVRALGRRSAPPLPPVLERGGVRLDPKDRTVTRDGRPVALTNKEFLVLEELLRAEGGVVSVEDLLARAWDDRIDPFSNVVRVIVATLRKKLGDPPVIHTVTGAGYRL
ncbi:response regulator transcription factor [Spirillospora sp. NPDC052269]